VLFNPGIGQIGFPTMMQGRAAYYSWQLAKTALVSTNSTTTHAAAAPPNQQDSNSRAISQR